MGCAETGLEKCANILKELETFRGSMVGCHTRYRPPAMAGLTERPHYSSPCRSARQLSQTHAALIAPLEGYVKKDFVQLAETRKRFSRSSDECDAAINKYAGRKPGKDSQLAEVCRTG